MKFTLGIRSQLGAGIILTTLAGIGLIGLLSVKIIETRSINWKISETENTVRFLRFIFARFPGGQQTREDAIRKVALAAEALKQAGINDFRFTDASGRELLKEGFPVKREGVGPPQAADQIFFSQGVKVYMLGNGWLPGSAGEALRVTASLDTFSKKNGSVDFDVPLADVFHDLALVKRFILAYALIDCVIIIVIGFYFLSKAITNPIKKLDDAATRIAAGALAERADVTVENEVGSLAASFNRMAGRVETEIKRLERVNMELVSAEDELLRSRTLAAMGSFSAGIAHEIWNPLGALQGYLDILEKGGADKEGERDIIRRMVSEAGRIDSIVREFLELARPSAKAAADVDVNALLKDTVTGLEMHKAFKGVEPLQAVKITTAFGSGMPLVFIDEGKLRQVFINLLLNAAQAVSGMGPSAGITVETGVEPPPLVQPLQGVGKEQVDSARLQRRITDTQLEREVDGAPGKEFVFIRFADNGPGISDDDAEKIFNPFFTTKDVGKGMGLGLFVSQGIIKTYGGEITFKTAKGEGTVFTVRLNPLRGLPLQGLHQGSL